MIVKPVTQFRESLDFEYSGVGSTGVNQAKQD